MTNKDLKRTHVHHGLHYRSLFLLALLGLFFTEIHAVPNVPSGFTEISSEYDNFDNFSTSSADYTTSGGWTRQTSGSETGKCAYKKTLSAGDYVGKNMHLTAGTYIFSYYIKIANAKPTTLKLCWDTSDFTKSSPEFTLNTASGGGDQGLSYESGEFTVLEGDYQLCTYVVSCESGETKLRVDGFYLYQKNAPLVAHSTTFKDLYWNSSDSLRVITETTGGAGITTPNVTAPDSWNFYGWALGTSFEYDYSGDPTVLAPNSSFFPNMDTTYTAVYSTGDVDNLSFYATPHGVTLDTTHVSVDGLYIDDWGIMCNVSPAENYALPNAITITLNGDTLSPSNYRWEWGMLELMGLQEGDYTFSIHGVVPVLATVSPSNESIGFGVDAYPTIHFSEPIQCNGVAIVDDASLQTVMTNSSFIDLLRITNTTTTSGVTQSQTPLDFTTSLSTDSTTITIIPTATLQDNSLHRIILQTWNLKNLTGEKSVVGEEVYFTTEATAPILATPTNFTMSSIDSDSATFSWTAVPDASRYVLERYYLHGRYPYKIDTVSGMTSHKFGIKYYMDDSLLIKVYAKGETGVSYDSEKTSLEYTPTKLTDPTNIIALVRDSSIVLSWDTVEHATEYRIRFSNSTIDSTYLTTSPSVAFLNLIPDKDYNIQLTAINGVSYINSNAVWADQTTLHHYTLTLDAQNGQVTPSSLEVCEGDTVTLPMATHDLTDWSFAGWSTATTTYTTAPQTFVNNTYVPSANRTLFAVYKQGSSIQGTQTITIDDSNIETGNYDTHNFDVTGLKSDGTTGDVFGFEGYYSLQSSTMQINSGKTSAYFGNTDPISGLNSISITSTSTGSGDFDLYQLNSPATSAPASATPIGSLARGTTQTFNFVPGQGDYFIATPHSGYGRISEIVINAEANIDNYVYNSNPVPPALIPITLEAGSGTVSGATSTVVDGYDHQETILIDAIPSDTNWSFVGWSATIVTNMDTLPDLVNTAFTPTKPVTLYAVYLYSDHLFKKVTEWDDITINNGYLIVSRADKKAMNHTPITIGSEHFLGEIDITDTLNQITTYDPSVVWNLTKYTKDEHFSQNFVIQSQETGAYLGSKNLGLTRQLCTKVEDDSFYEIYIDAMVTMIMDNSDMIDRSLTYVADSGFTDRTGMHYEDDLTLYKNSTIYTHTIEEFTVTVHVDETSHSFSQSSFVTGPQLDVLVAPFHDMMFTGWSENEIDSLGIDTVPVYTTFPITEDKTIYAIYQNNLDLKYYSIIPNSDLIITDDNDSTELHQGDSFTSIIVNKNKTLRINSNTHLKSLIINPGAHVNLDSAFSFSTGWLHFIGQDDNPSALSIPKDSVLNTQMDYTIVVPDNSRYHFFSLPYDCYYGDLIIDGGDWINIQIGKYNSESRSDGNDSINWYYLNRWDSIKANVGYCIAIDLTTPINVTFTPASPAFHFTNDTNRHVSLKATHGTADGGYQGWNLVGSSYLDATGKGLYRRPSNINFVNQPNFVDSCQSYFQKPVDEAVIEAFSAYFVQVGADKDLQFTYPAVLNGAPLFKEDRLKLSLSNQTGDTDPTYIDVQTQYTTDYEIGYDLLKMLGQSSRPQFFSLSGQEQRAFNALPETAINSIDLGFYTGTTDNYTISADNASRFLADHLYLTDRLNQVTTDLMITPYYFNGTAGELNTSRFVLNIVRAETPTDYDSNPDGGIQIYSENGQLSINNLEAGSWVDVVDATGKIIYSQAVNDSNLSLKAATGLYIIRITLKNKSFTTYKTLMK